jgi:hypothetical protein
VPSSISDMLARMRSEPGRALLLLGSGLIALLLGLFLHLYLGLAAAGLLTFGALRPDFHRTLADSSPSMAAPESIHQGALAWDPPGTMRVGTSQRISVRIGDAQVALATLLDGLRGGPIVAQDIRIGARMRVQLMAAPEDFRIAVLSNQDQLLSRGAAARWDFDVTPRRSGLRRLRLLASTRMMVSGKEEVRDLPAYERDVAIAVAPLYSIGRFLKSNWKWVLATLGSTIVWLLYATGLAEKAVHALRALFG